MRWIASVGLAALLTVIVTAVCQALCPPGNLGLLIPASVKQGEVAMVKVTGIDEAKLVELSATELQQANKLTVSLGNYDPKTGTKIAKTISLFPSKTPGERLGLLPVSVFQKPGDYMVILKGSEGELLNQQPIKVVNANFRIQNIQVSKQTKGLQPEKGELETVAALKNLLTPSRYWDESFVSPTTDCQNSPFGVLRYHNGKPTDDYHKGVDLRSPLGRPVKATSGGKIVIARKFQLHGGTVGIDHGQGVSSIYIHMSAILVKPGDVVKKGDVIGKVGATGFATGPHLHWGLFMNGLPINPNQWVKAVPKC